MNSLFVPITIGADKRFKLKSFPYDITGYSFSAAIIRKGQTSGSPVATFSVSVDTVLREVTFTLSSAITTAIASGEYSGYIFETSAGSFTRELAKLRVSVTQAGA